MSGISSDTNSLYHGLEQSTQCTVEKQEFNILDHLEKLTPTKTKGKYLCPACGGNDLSISKSGAYQCWHGCDVRNIREAIAPWDEVKKGNHTRTPYSSTPRKAIKSPKPKPAPIPDGEIKLARLEGEIKHPTKEKVGDRTITRYYYSDHQWVQRIEFPDPKKPKGYDKTTKPWHFADGNTSNTKGPDEWLPYRMDEVATFGAGKWVLGLEGEACVEAARYLGLVSFTLLGADWGDKAIAAAVSHIKNAGVLGIGYFPDNDDVGAKKAQAIATACAKIGLPFITLNPLALWDKIPEKGDIADWVKAMKGEDFDKEQAVEWLEKIFNESAEAARNERHDVEVEGDEPQFTLREAVAEAEAILRSTPDALEANILLEELRQKVGIKEWDWDNKYVKEIKAKIERGSALGNTDQNGQKVPDEADPYEVKKLALKAIAQEKDQLKYTDKLVNFCRRYGWRREDAERQIQAFKIGTTTPVAEVMRGSDFLKMETQTIGWVFAGIIAKQGVTIIAGDPGVGKTTMVYDAVGSQILNQEFLGELPLFPDGKVLVVLGGDEPECYTQDTLINRGIPLDNQNWDVMRNWDISLLQALEEKVADYKPTLVVIDSFSSIHRDPNFDENSSQAKKSVYDLQSLASSYNFGCVIIHHTNKSKDSKGVGKLRGSSAIAAACSTVMLMEKGSNEENRRIHFPKMRGAQNEGYTVSFDKETGRFEVISGGDDQSTKSLGDRVLAFLSKSPDKRFEQCEIAEALGISSLNKDALYVALGRLFKRGLIVKRPSSLGGKRKVYGVVSNNLSTPLSPPPSRLKVLGSFTETIDTQGVEIPNTYLTNDPNTYLTPEIEDGSVSGWNQEPEQVVGYLTNTGVKGGESVPDDSEIVDELPSITQQRYSDESKPNDQEAIAPTTPAPTPTPQHEESLIELKVGDRVTIDTPASKTKDGETLAQGRYHGQCGAISGFNYEGEELYMAVRLDDGGIGDFLPKYLLLIRDES